MHYRSLPRFRFYHPKFNKYLKSGDIPFWFRYTDTYRFFPKWISHLVQIIGLKPQIRLVCQICRLKH